MSNMRREMADDGIGIFDLRFSPNFHKRFAGYDKREVELYIRRQEAIMTKIRLEKEQLERQVIRLRQQVANAKEQLAEAMAQGDAAKAELAVAKAGSRKEAESPETSYVETNPNPDIGKSSDVETTKDAEPSTETVTTDAAIVEVDDTEASEEPQSVAATSDAQDSEPEDTNAENSEPENSELESGEPEDSGSDDAESENTASEGSEAEETAAAEVGSRA